MNASVPSIACVVPTHERPEGLARALRSIKSQTLGAAAIIVVDDVGSAATADQVSGAAAVYVDGSSFPRKGASASRNAGAAASDSAYLAFLDDDDRWEDDFLRQGLATLQATGADLVATWGSLEMGGRVVGTSWQLQDGVTSDDAVAHNPGITGSNFIIRRSVFEELGGFDEELPVYNDLDFFVRFLRGGHTYAVVRHQLVIQNADGADHLSSRSERRAAGILAYTDKHRAHATASQLRRLKRDYHLALRYRGQNRIVSAAHFALMWANSTPAQVTRVLREKLTRGTAQYS